MRKANESRCVTKTHANGRNTVGPTCSVRLHGTTTMLALVVYRFETSQTFGATSPNISIVL